MDQTLLKRVVEIVTWSVPNFSNHMIAYKMTGTMMIPMQLIINATVLIGLVTSKNEK